MKQLTCEMCGSTELLKQEGVFLCQECGTKYSVEEARKMMTEGTDEVAKKVSIDNTARLDNLYKLARRAKDENNTEKAAQYYEQILLEDPISWEAAFYATYYSAIQKWRNDEKGSSISLLRNCIDNVIDIIKENVNDENDQMSAIKEVSEKINGICGAFCNANEEDLESFYDEYKEAGYSSHNQNIFQQCLKQTSYINGSISEVYYALGEKMLGMLETESDLDDMAKAIMEVAITTARRNPCDYILRAYSQMDGIGQLKRDVDEYNSKLVESYNNGLRQVEEKQEALAKRRFTEYWDAHQSEKKNLESERQSLNEQIDSLNKEIITIPQKIDGYSIMVEHQKKVENLNSEKKALGVFKLKEKKAIQEQIDSMNSEIAPIQARIDAAIGEVNQRIKSLASRIEAIYTELTKSR